MDSVIAVRGKNLLLGLTDGTDYTDYFVVDYNLFPKEPRKAYIRGLCAICERRKLLKIYL